MENKFYEQCNHKWETIKKYKEYIATSGSWLTENKEQFKPVFIQKCAKCGKINKV